MIDINDLYAHQKVLPVLMIERLEDAVPLTKALVKGGLRAIEVTLRTDCALDAISKIASEVPSAIVGVGSIRTVQDITNSRNAGAVFGVSPGTTDSLLDGIENAAFHFVPGCSTPSEAMRLAEAGFSLLKFFPAEAAGGTNMLKSIHGPLPNIKFCPTGGINPKNAEEYLNLANVPLVGGSWVAPKSLVDANDWQTITQLANACLFDVL